jgi:polyhydroxyalkanoate synthase
MAGRKPAIAATAKSVRARAKTAQAAAKKAVSTKKKTIASRRDGPSKPTRVPRKPRAASGAIAAAPAAAAPESRPASTQASTAPPNAGTFAERVIDNAMGQNVLGDFRPADLIGVAAGLVRRSVARPRILVKAGLGFFGELGKIAAGESHLSPEPGDRRFADPAWREQAFFAGTLQAYLALRQSMKRYAAHASRDARQAERIQFLLSQIGDAVAPSNFLLSNPAALRRAKETYGLSVVRGAKNLIGDVLKRRSIPSQVDETAFEVGSNLAVTPGMVVLRTDMFELIEYAPQTPQVRHRPILVVPSIVNKYYVLDIAPGRSVLEHFVKQGLTVFVMVWRNPQRRHDRWGMPEYQDAVDAALDAVRAIRKVDDVNVWAVCGAGPVVVSLAGHYAAVGQRRIHTLMLVVSPLDMQAMSQAPGVGALVEQAPAAEPARLQRALRNKRISAKEFSLLFAMLRANELIWNYWVSNYLMGDAPSAFDVLYWNGDGTGMTAQFNHDFSAFVAANPFVTPGAMKVRGKAIADLSQLGIDSYVLGAANDHLCIWQGVYRSAQLLGARSRFVLGNSGHIQTIVCPPGNPKSSYCTNETAPADATADEWLRGATRHGGSWWDHCVAWTTERAGPLVRAPRAAGNRKYPPLCAAPGTYVHERG